MIQLKNKFGKVFLEISHNEEGRWVYDRWIGLLSVENVIEGATQVLEELKKSGYTRILNDNREIIGGWEGATDWIAQDWMPKALAMGLKQFAHLVSPGIYGEASAEEMRQKVGENFEMRLFKIEAEANQWLTQNAEADIK